MNTTIGFSHTSDGPPIKLIDNADGSYSLAVFAVGASVPTTVNLQYSQTNTVTVSSSTAETSLVGGGVGTVTLPANFFSVGKVLKLFVSGIHSTTGNPSVTFKIKLGGTTLMSSGAVPSNAGSNQAWLSEARLTCRSVGTTGTIIGQGWYAEPSQSNLAGMPMTAVATIDTTGTLAVDVTWQWSVASASNTMSCTNLTIESIS